jgi:hypothetical protein
MSLGSVRTRLAAVALVLGALGAGCGGGGAGPERTPSKVALELVPDTVNEGAFRLTEDDKARDAFSAIGSEALVADGRLFAIRDGDRLVGTLQLSTMKTKVDLTDDDQRASVISNVLPGTRETISVGPVSVIQAAGADKTVFVWFGRDLFQVLQLKPTAASPFDPEKVLSEIITYQTAQDAWDPLPRPDED